MLRREMLALIVAGGMVSAAPASACRAPRAKDRTGYKRIIDGLLAAWWSRDFPAFSKYFRHADVAQPFDAHAVFHEHFEREESRRLGGIMFNGASAVVQIVTLRGPDAYHGICGGYASADLFLVKFYAGIEVPVVAELRHLDRDLLASGEWEGA